LNIVVTGATSMIGEAVIEASLKRGDRVLAIARKNSPKLSRLPESENIKLCFYDLAGLKDIEAQEEKYDAFFHFAWGNTNRNFRDDPVLQEENVKYTLDAVELAHRLGCKSFVFAGSQAEYGLKTERITPETRPDPVVAYGMAKLSAEMLSRKLCDKYEMKHVALRIFSVYGSYDSDSTLVSYAVDTFLKGEKASFSAATNIWNFLYSTDAGEMIYRLGTNDAESGIYLIAGKESTSLKNYINTIISLFENAKSEFAEADTSRPTVNLDVDISKTIEASGYEPETSFEDGVKKVIEYRKTLK
jgi:nucleoside-diphosphate-sugar epimerase